MDYLLIGNVCVWAGVGAYLVLIWGTQKSVVKRLEQMELLSDDGK